MLSIASDFALLIRSNKILIYLFLSVVLLISDFNNYAYTNTIRHFTLSKLMVVQEKQNAFYHLINEMIDNAREFVSLKQENERLREEKRVLEKYFLMTRHMEQEYIALKKLMNIVPDKKIEFVTSYVLGDLTTPYSSSIMVSGGEADKIKKGQAVINQDGLVGRVIDIMEKNSRIMLVNDMNSHIPIITEKTRERAIVSGTHDHGILKMKYLSEDTKIEVGEFVFTSGDGKLFPPGLLVGTVTKIKNNEYFVTPAVNFKKLDYVILVEY
ncbi:MAG: rod shape-determining protein MreC [Alphaproteobacteria bacterium]|nr:rod shape-determining protein MreC [Alphaproteobacteria bacterium]OJV12231.1 MAG: rod shape-determining protein MreC [Alphaproteobacteria bacterium 33-17]